MSEPRPGSEQERAELTLAQAGPAENLVSTGCPECKVRFAMLAALGAEDWLLRCVNCGWWGRGNLKDVTQEEPR